MHFKRIRLFCVYRCIESLLWEETLEQGEEDMGQLIALCIGFFGLVAGTEGANTPSIRYIANTTPAQHHVFIVAHEDDW
jgi:hypothetical protein